MAYYRILKTNRNFLSNLSVTAWLILINVVVFLAVFIASYFYSDLLTYIALKPADLLAGKNIWTIFTHFFMHGGFLHLFVNMFVLFSLGSLMEKIIGRKRFLAFYLVSGILAGLLFIVLSGLFGFGIGALIFGSPDISAVGASGAIFAIAGLFVILLPKIRFAIIFLPFFSLPGYIMIPVVLVLTWVVSISTGLPVGNVAHLGGFLAGIVYGLYLKNKYKKKIQVIRRYFR